MGLFSKQRAYDRLEDRLRSIELKCDDLERSRKNLDLEFTELYDKVRHQMSRMAKRDARQQKIDAEETPTDDAFNSLDTVDPISKSILRRRGMGVPPE